MQTLRASFLLDPTLIFLNHGSYGAVPQPVYDAYQAWHRRVELDPVSFYAKTLAGELADSRAKIAAHFGVDPDGLVYVRNVTFGVNVVARSVDLRPGDEVLTTDQEYGACVNAWEAACEAKGATLVRRPIGVPVGNPEDAAKRFMEGAAERTRAVFLSHVTSFTANRLPVAEVSAIARSRGVVSVVDGAHAPGQIDLDVGAVGADVYVGSLHKWFLAPKGCAFLWTRPELRAKVAPLVVGHPYSGRTTGGAPAYYVAGHSFLGTDDYAPYLTAPDALAFQEANGWAEVRRAARRRLHRFLERCDSDLGLTPLLPSGGSSGLQMASVVLPPQTDLAELGRRLYDRYRVVVPLFAWGETKLLRVSVQGYTSDDELDALLAALREEVATSGA